MLPSESEVSEMFFYLFLHSFKWLCAILFLCFLCPSFLTFKFFYYMYRKFMYFFEYILENPAFKYNCFEYWKTWISQKYYAYTLYIYMYIIYKYIYIYIPKTHKFIIATLDFCFGSFPSSFWRLNIWKKRLDPGA